MPQALTVRACRAIAGIWVCCLWQPAPAATYDLTLTGQVADATTYGYDYGGIHHENWDLRLSGLSASNSFTMGVGDSVHATIALDRAVAVPRSDPYSIFGFTLTGAAFPANVLAAISGTNTLYLHGVEVRTGGLGSSAYGELYNGMALVAPFDQAYNFDTVVSDFTISSMDQAVTLDSAAILYYVQHPVPEPATACVLTAGLSLLGLRFRSRPRRRTRTAGGTSA